MTFDELATTVKELDRADKFRMVQILLDNLATEEGILLKPDQSYPIYTPYDAYEAAQDLLDALNEDSDVAG